MLLPHELAATRLQFAGLVVVMSSVRSHITVTRTADMRDWRTWALLLPLGASVLQRGVGKSAPVIKVGIWKSGPVRIARWA